MHFPSWAGLPVGAVAGAAVFSLGVLKLDRDVTLKEFLWFALIGAAAGATAGGLIWLGEWLPRAREQSERNTGPALHPVASFIIGCVSLVLCWVAVVGFLAALGAVVVTRGRSYVAIAAFLLSCMAHFLYALGASVQLKEAMHNRISTTQTDSLAKPALPRPMNPMLLSPMIQRALISFAIVLLTGWNASSTSAADHANGDQADVAHPNIVIIYGDDVGYGDVGAYGAELIPTPNIDRLASEGLRFTDGHCSAATCTPSRFSMLTGIFGFRHNVRVLPPNAPMTIKPDMLTLPQMLQQAGYHTAVIGKWHLGIGDGETPVDWNGDVQPGPLEVGFDYSFLLPSTNDRVPCVYVENHRVVNLDESDPLFVGKKPVGVVATEYPDGKTNREAMTYYQSSHGHDFSIINGIGRIGYQWGGKSALWNDETMSDVFVEQAKKYLAAREQDKPFFLYFSSQDIHVPRAPHPRFHGVSKLSYRGDAMVQLDWSTGEILKALEEHGLTENTIVIFTSDNGPVYDDGYEDGTTVRTSTAEVDRGHDGSGIYRGGKYQIYEGGTRVPFIVRWPGRIEPGTSDALVNQIDFLASFAALVDVDVPEEQAADSRNILPALLGEDKSGLPYMVEEAGRRVALRQGPWKFIAREGNNPTELYNLEADPGEANNVAAQHADVVAELRAKLQAIRQSDTGLRGMEK